MVSMRMSGYDELVKAGSPFKNVRVLKQTGNEDRIFNIFDNFGWFDICMLELAASCEWFDILESMDWRPCLDEILTDIRCGRITATKSGIVVTLRAPPYLASAEVVGI